MLSSLSDEEMRWLYREAAALIAASYEDFGLTPLEAASNGTPSIVLRAGGFLDTMVEGETAVFFDSPDPASISDGIDRFFMLDWDELVLEARADHFTDSRFHERIAQAAGL